MFISGSSGYNRRGEQTARGDFLMVFARGQELRAAIRYVRMRQLGHWMITSGVKVGPYKLTLSGSYGSDGLPIESIKKEPRKCWERIGDSDHWYERTYAWEDVPTVNWESLAPLPLELQQEFWHPECQGWNSAGSEAKNLKDWARNNLKTLKSAGK